MNLTQALSILRPDGNDFEALKKARRKASMKHHPDHGGDVEMMKLVNEAYEVLNEKDYTDKHREDAEQTEPLTEIFQRIIERLNNCNGLVIEVIGSWLWVSGNTKQHKDILKACEMKHAKKKEKWYFSESSSSSRGSLSMQEIRERYQAGYINKKKQSYLAA